MAKKWTNKNQDGVLHYVTGNVDRRRSIFRNEAACLAFLEVMQCLRPKYQSKLICFVVMLDHFHLIVNPRDGNIRGWLGELKSLSANKLIDLHPPGLFAINDEENRVWQGASRAKGYGAVG